MLSPLCRVLHSRAKGSTRTNPAVISTAGTPQLVVTVDKDANNEALRRIHEWFAGVNLAQILYLTTGTNHLMIQGRDGTGINGTYVPVDYEGMRFLQAKPIDFKEHGDPNRLSLYPVRSNHNGYSTAIPSSN